MLEANSRRVLFGVLLGSFVTPLMLSGVNIAVPSIAASLGGDAVAISWIASAYLLSTTVFMLPAGRIADMSGRKRVYVTGCLVILFCSLAAASAQSLGQLIGLRLLQGLGSAMLFATGTAILASVFPPELRGRMIGLSVSMVYVGLTCGPLLGGWFIEQFGWRSVFLYYTPVILLSGLVLATVEDEWKGVSGGRFDLAGALSYALAISALMYGVSRLPAGEGAILAILGVLGLAGFTAIERRRPDPLLDVSLFSSRAFSYSATAALTMYTAVFANTYLMSVYLQTSRGIAPATAGLVIMVQPLIMAVVSPVAGRLADRVEARWIVSLGFAITALGLWLLALLTPESTMSYIVTALLMTGLGFALFVSPNINAIMGAVDKRHYGLASSAVGTARVAGQMLSMGIVTLSFALWLGDIPLDAADPQQLMATVTRCFTILAALCLPGMYFSLARGRVHRTGA